MTAASRGKSVPLVQKQLASALGMSNIETLGEFWTAFLAQEKATGKDPFERVLVQHILTSGSLGERMLRQCGENPTRENLEKMLESLCQDLAKDPIRANV